MVIDTIGILLIGIQSIKEGFFLFEEAGRNIRLL
jgi:hypothetical protein